MTKIILSEIERRPCKAYIEDGVATNIVRLTVAERDALCAVVRAIWFFSNSHPLHPADIASILARHGIELDAKEGT